jgi:hypothetical protein
VIFLQSAPSFPSKARKRGWHPGSGQFSEALEMPLDERRKRCQAMKDVLRRTDITVWRESSAFWVTEPS